MKSTAERQAAYRQRHLHDEDGTKARLNVLIHQPAKLALARLAKHKGLTQADFLTHLLLAEQARVIADMDGDQQNAYYDAVTA